MTTRIIAVVTIAALLNAVLGCSTTKLVRPDKLKEQPQKNIHKVGLTSGDEITFLPPGGVFDAQKQVVRGAIRDSLSQIKAVEIKVDDIQYVKIVKIRRSAEERNNVGCIVGGLLIVVVVIMVYVTNTDLGPSWSD